MGKLTEAIQEKKNYKYREGMRQTTALLRK